MLPALVATVLAGLGLAGCAGADGGGAGRGTGAATPGPATSAAVPAETPSSTGQPAGGPGGINRLGSLVAGATGSATPATASVTGTVTATEGAILMFVTPSKNIGCALTSTEVRCDIAERNWKPPARPVDCELDFGQGIGVGDREAGFVCAGDTVLGGPTVLDYGLAAQDGDLQCLSAKEGVTCRNLATGHGFTLSREAYALF